MAKCGHCGKGNSDEAIFCQFCGGRLAGQPVPPVNEQPEVAELKAVLSRLVSDRQAESTNAPPRAPYVMPPISQARSAPARPNKPVAPTPMSRPVPAQAPPRPAPTPAAGARPIPMPPMAMSAQPPVDVELRSLRPGGEQDLRLIVVHRDGSDGAVYSLVGSQIDLGRTEGDLLFEDAHLGDRHARIRSGPEGHVLSSLENLNGIFLRLRANVPLEIGDGDRILAGKQLLELEMVAEVERNLRPAVEHGIVLFGSSDCPAWGRLRQVTATGVGRDVFHLSRNEVVIGREQGDIVFSDDEFMSRRHARLAFQQGRVVFEDLGSSNGSFVKLRAPYTLASGDLVRMGDQLMRFEFAVGGEGGGPNLPPNLPR